MIGNIDWGGVVVSETDVIVRIILEHYPTAQAIYLFGAYGTADEWPDSDVDIAVLLPPEEARQQPQLMLAPCFYALADALGKYVDLLNARELSTVFQKEIIRSGRRLYSADDAAAEFEMLTLSHYQKLNEEREAILEAFEKSGKAYPV
jgi:predicted nucleotidyltransferase